MARNSQDRTAARAAQLSTIVGQLPQWANKAACRSAEPEEFYPEKGDDASKAKVICKHRCTVRAQCLQWALETGEPWGVWGGMTAEERKRLRRQPIADPLAGSRSTGRGRRAA